MSERSAGLSFKLGRDERLTGIRRHTFDPVEVLLWALLNELSVGFSSHKPEHISNTPISELST